MFFGTDNFLASYNQGLAYIASPEIFGSADAGFIQDTYSGKNKFLVSEFVGKFPDVNAIGQGKTYIL